MGSTSLNIRVVDKRMYRLAEAAAYCGLSGKHFNDICPVRPVALRSNVDLYDKRDLDRWIDAGEDGDFGQTASDILGMLE